MLEWFLLTAGGAAIYAASKWFRHNRRSSRCNSVRHTTGKYGQPLKLVVAQCEARWFLQDLKLAMSGDVEAMVRVSHMMMAGYGTHQDHTAAAAWMRQAWAIQNYKEPALMHDMLDIRDSDIPALNEAAAAAAHKTIQAVQAAGDSNSSSSGSGSAGLQSRGVGRTTAATVTAGSTADGSRPPSGHASTVQCPQSVNCRGGNSSGCLQHEIGELECQRQQQQLQWQHKCLPSGQCMQQSLQQQQQQQQQQQHLLTLPQLTTVNKCMLQHAKQRLRTQRLAAAAAVCLGSQEQQSTAAAAAVALACHEL